MRPYTSSLRLSSLEQVAVLVSLTALIFLAVYIYIYEADPRPSHICIFMYVCMYVCIYILERERGEREERERRERRAREERER